MSVDEADIPAWLLHFLDQHPILSAALEVASLLIALTVERLTRE
jgi:hypothetical protein